MQTPSRVTLEGFYLARGAFLAHECTTNEATNRVLCRKCGGRIKMQAAQIEIHDAANGQCKANGEEFEAGIPYCPGCEEMPMGVGCVHA